MLGLADFFIGIIVGIATNLLSWWILFHKIVPEVLFSSEISKTPITHTDDDRSGFEYRFKFENAGQRAIIDMEIMARLRIKGLGPYTRTNWQVIQVPLSVDGSTSHRIPRLRPVRAEKQVRHVLRLFVNSAHERFARQIFSREIRSKALSRTLHLEDLLATGTDAYLEIEAFGFDEFSGARKLFLSQRYKLADIKIGAFDQRGLAVSTTASPSPEADSPENDDE